MNSPSLRNLIRCHKCELLVRINDNLARMPSLASESRRFGSRNPASNSGSSFERYAKWTANGSIPRSEGLGLAIAKEIVEPMVGGFLTRVR